MLSLSLSFLVCSSVHIMSASFCNFWLWRETGFFSFAALVSDISTETHKLKQEEINMTVNTDLREFIIKCDTKELVSEANAWEERKRKKNILFVRFELLLSASNSFTFPQDFADYSFSATPTYHLTFFAILEIYKNEWFSNSGRVF